MYICCSAVRDRIYQRPKVNLERGGTDVGAANTEGVGVTIIG